MGTRPDITFTVNKTNQYLEKPSKIHWNANFQIFKENNKIWYFSIEQNNHIKAFNDTDYAGDTEIRKLLLY